MTNALAFQHDRSSKKLPHPSRNWSSLLAISGVLLVWQMVAMVVGKGGLLLPTPLQVVAALIRDRAIIVNGISATISTAFLGLLIGTVIAVVLALPTIISPKVRRLVVRQMTIFYCLPLVTIAPLLYLVSSGRAPQIIMAAMSVLFPVFIAFVQGLGAAHPMWQDLVGSLGGSKWQYFKMVQLPAATREFFTAARIGAPAAVLGATLAEYFGGTKGLGVAMVNSLAQLNAPRAYALGAVITLLSSGIFLLVGYLNRKFFSWTEELGNEH